MPKLLFNKSEVDQLLAEKDTEIARYLARITELTEMNNEVYDLLKQEKSLLEKKEGECQALRNDYEWLSRQMEMQIEHGKPQS